MNLKLLVCSGSTLEESAQLSPRLFTTIEEAGYGIDVIPWDGYADTLPQGEPVLVQAWDRMPGRVSEVALRCSGLGHLFYYKDRPISEGGCLLEGGIVESVLSFLQLPTVAAG